MNSSFTGEPILYSLTIPTKVNNYAGAVEFVQYLLRGNGRQLLLEDGLSIIPLQFEGDLSAVPEQLLNSIVRSRFELPKASLESFV